MKQLILIFLATLMLIGCKAKQTVIKENDTVSLIDTTRTVADTMGAVSNYSETTTATKHVEQSATIEFVDGGGTVSIDTAGNITIQGLKSIKGTGKADVTIKNGVTNRDSISALHTEKANGVTNSESRSSHGEIDKKTEKPVLHQTVLAKIGWLCCIAALLWALFLYLKRKF